MLDISKKNDAAMSIGLIAGLTAILVTGDGGVGLLVLAATFVMARVVIAGR